MDELGLFVTNYEYIEHDSMIIIGIHCPPMYRRWLGCMGRLGDYGNKPCGNGGIEAMSAQEPAIALGELWRLMG